MPLETPLMCAVPMPSPKKLVSSCFERCSSPFKRPLFSICSRATWPFCFFSVSVSWNLEASYKIWSYKKKTWDMWNFYPIGDPIEILLTGCCCWRGGDPQQFASDEVFDDEASSSGTVRNARWQHETAHKGQAEEYLCFIFWKVVFFSTKSTKTAETACPLWGASSRRRLLERSGASSSWAVQPGRNDRAYGQLVECLNLRKFDFLISGKYFWPTIQKHFIPTECESRHD